ncbi:hypothetical protein FALBO_6852 [Fusarium albosuccineum]|uniref:AB hydrolase-1 domain-containing protein n=1 Tax=Fusarium albosuccineum TaxID=1237068 RepID=A0A8H4PJX8_9HYPO|nr:hypothetical protein FALBO_6852 [Fusarium albosuccineum]
MNMGVKCGLDLKMLAGAINVSSGRCYNSLEQNPVKVITPRAASENDFVGGFSVELCKGVLEMALELGSAVGAQSRLGDPVLGIYDKAVQDERCKGRDSRSIYKLRRENSTHLDLFSRPALVDSDLRQWRTPRSQNHCGGLVWERGILESIQHDKFPPVARLSRLCSCSASATHINVEAIDVIVGFSMGGQCSYYWTLMHPEMVRNAVIICSSARTSRHNYQFLEGPKAALEYSADYQQRDGNGSTPGGLRAFGKAYSAWLTSPEWFEQEQYKSLGYETLSAWDYEVAGTNYSSWHPDDLLSKIAMWQRGDITSLCGPKDESLPQALSRIKAHVLLMPCQTDQYFRREASEKQSDSIPHATLKIIPSVWGHLAGLGVNAADKEWMNEAIADFLKES